MHAYNFPEHLAKVKEGTGKNPLGIFQIQIYYDRRTHSCLNGLEFQ
jgi:hypothetical protein